MGRPSRTEFIEAIVFTPDAFHSRSSSLSDFHHYEDHHTTARYEGIMRKEHQLISYDSAEDLTRKVNDLFYRRIQMSSLTFSTDIHDDMRDDYNNRNAGGKGAFDLDESIGDAASTCPSTNPSTRGERDELPFGYCSSITSSDHESYSRRHTTPGHCLHWMKQNMSKNGQNSVRHRKSKTFDSINEYNLPEIMNGIMFKKSCSGNLQKRQRKQLEVISLPSSLTGQPSESTLQSSSSARTTRELGQETQIPFRHDFSFVTKNEESSKEDSQPAIKEILHRFRRLGRKTKKWWNEHVAFLYPVRQ